MRTTFWFEILKARDNTEDIGINKRIILKLIYENSVRLSIVAVQNGDR
jgi:hypothetical protein